MTATTTDTGVAGHLVARGYELTHVDRTGTRWVYHFALEQHLLDHESGWYHRHRLSDSRACANLLAGLGRGKPVSGVTLERFPCLRNALSEEDHA